MEYRHLFIQSRLARDYALGTTDADETWLLPTSPLAGILIGIKALTAAANLADSALTLASQLLSIQVRFRGAQIYAISGDDLLRFTTQAGIWSSRLWNPAVANDSRRSMELWLPFGRTLFSPTECFPGSSKGESELYISWDAVTASYDNLLLNISPIELPEANPSQFLRVTTMSDTPAATGDKDYDLPRLAPVAGIGVFHTASYPDNATTTINSIKVLLNNLDTGYTDIDPVSARGLCHLGLFPDVSSDTWVQQENSAGAYTQNALTIANHTVNGPGRDYFYLDYDPIRDGKHLLNGPAATDLKLRINFGATSAIRLHPVELFRPELLPGRRTAK